MEKNNNESTNDQRLENIGVVQSQDFSDSNTEVLLDEKKVEDHPAFRHRNRDKKDEDLFVGKQGRRQHRQSKSANSAAGIAIVAEQLPGVLSKEIFQELANFKDGITISIFIPTRPSGVEGNEHFGQAAFKNILNTVSERLDAKGYEQIEIEQLLKPVADLTKDNDFWLEMTEGLGIFIAKGLFKYVKMPLCPEQEIVIEPTFYVTPLVPLITSNEYFFLLTISKKTIKLFKADCFGMQIVPLELYNENGDTKSGAETKESTDGLGESGVRKTPILVHGQLQASGDGTEEKDNLANYFEAVDDILWEKVLNKENAPLVLAGVEYEIPIYKSVCDYHNVWETSLTGNREYQDTASLYKDARGIMQPYFDQKKIKALEMYGNKSATVLTSSIVDDVIPATYYGRVSHLFVAKGEHVWGTFNEMENKLTVHENVDGVSEDLIDNAVVKTLATGGEVYVLDRTEMPADSCVAALMRY
jgi:hypothetical protein